jgi:hypothetical protein
MEEDGRRGEADIIRDTIMERLGVTLMVAQEVADLIRERIETAANVFQENMESPKKENTS